MGSRQVLVQMSGVPGSGKSSVAQSLVRERRFVALDHDVVKTAILDAGVPFSGAGAVSYTTLFALAGDLLRQGHNVVIDSPCLYPEVLHGGQQVARHLGARYAVVECVTDDIELIDARLRSRTPLRSQRPSVTANPRDLADEELDDGRALFRHWMTNMQRPEEHHLRLDTGGALDSCAEAALALVDELRE